MQDGREHIRREQQRNGGCKQSRRIKARSSKTMNDTKKRGEGLEVDWRNTYSLEAQYSRPFFRLNMMI